MLNTKYFIQSNDKYTYDPFIITNHSHLTSNDVDVIYNGGFRSDEDPADYYLHHYLKAVVIA